MKKGSIKAKFITSIIITTVIALLVSSAAMVMYNLRSYRANTTDDLTAHTSLLGHTITPALQFNDPDSAQNYLRLLESQPKILEAAIFDKDGTLFAGYKISETTPKKISVKVTRKGNYVDGKSLVAFEPIVENNEIIGSVFLRMNYELFSKLQGNIVISLGGILLALIIAFFVSLNLQRSITGPLRSITKLARKLIDTKDYSLRAKSSHDGEVGYLTEAFNDMLDEVEQHKQALEITNRELANKIIEQRRAEESLKQSEEHVLQLNSELEQRVHDRTVQLEVANNELESFSYSVSHDLRTPLRAIDGFSQALLEDYEDKLDAEGKNYLLRVRAGAQRMGTLIDDMLKLSRVSRAEINFQDVNISKMYEQILGELKDAEPHRHVETIVEPDLHAECDPHLINIALSNLLSNAWKYSSKQPTAKIEFGRNSDDDKTSFYVKDNGVGFDMAYINKLFGAFQRLHTDSEFPGTGIGLATVKRVITRHGGLIWADAAPDEGAVFSFTLPSKSLETDSKKESI